MKASLRIFLAGPALIHATIAWSAKAPPPDSLESQTLYYSRILKPIPDDQWHSIAGAQISETYQIAKGDTLFDISKRLFGDGKYWPKIWALNHAAITNAHRIFPGTRIAFMPGTGTSLPSVSAEAGASAVASDAAPAVTVARRGRSQEWRELPPQPWESVTLQLPPEIDPHGIDRRSSVISHAPGKLELQAIAATDTLGYVGEIIGSRSHAKYLTIGDTVFIKAVDNIQVGDTYIITDYPELVKSPQSDRAGYSYYIIGKLKVVGVRDDQFIGTILTNRSYLPRGTFVMPLPAPVHEVSPIAGPEPLEAIVMVDKTFSTDVFSQHHQVFVDRGTDDGVKPGMVFRLYQHEDPHTEKRIIDGDFIVDADVLVLQTSERFSTGIVLSSRGPIEAGRRAILLTDVSDITRDKKVIEKKVEGGESETSDELDELDKLDSGEGMGSEERRELKQLEKHQGATETAAPAAEPIAPPPPGDETPSAAEPGAESESPPPGAEAPPASEAPPPPPPGEEATPPPPADEASGAPPPSEEAPPPPIDEELESPPPPAE